ncbi:MAG: CARDB domain-containing protein [Candidatus Zixiibacteriota bacterium]
MINKKITYIAFTMILLAISCLFGQYEFLGVRSRARADGGIAVMNDGSCAMLNPGMTGFLRGKSFSAGYNYYMVGMDDGKLRRGYIAYNHRVKFPLANIGLFAGSFADGVRRETVVGLNLAYRERGTKSFRWGFGINPKLLLASYSPEDGDYMEGRDRPPSEDPFFADYGESKTGFSLDAGLYARVHKKFRFALTGRDIIMPDMGFGQPSIVQPDFNAGVFYYIHSKFQPFCDFSFRPETDNADKQLEPRAGFITKFSSTVRTSFAANTRMATAGISFRTPSVFRGLEIDYAFAYPISELSSSILTSHYMGFTAYVDRLVYHDIDLQIMDIRPLEDLNVGEKTPIQMIIYNKGPKKAQGFSTTLYSLDENGKYKTIYPTKFVDGLCGDCYDTLEYNFTPKEIGQYYIIASVDDNGFNPKEIMGTIDEDDEENNRDSIFVDLSESPPVASIEPMQMTARAQHVSLLEEEYPIIPLVFFDANDIAVEGAGNIEIIDIISRRMVENPDAELEIRSFADKSDDENAHINEAAVLAEKRNQAIYDRLLAENPSIQDRVVRIDVQDYDYTSQRILTDRDFKGDEMDMITAENRRGEFAVRIKNAVRMPSTVSLSKGDDGKTTTINLDAELLEVLDRNPDARLMIKGIRLSSENENIAITRANNLLKSLTGKYPKSKDKMIAVGVTGDSPSIEISLSFDGILYRPELGPPIVENFEGFQNNENTIEFDITNSKSVKTWEAFAIVGNDRVAIESGEGVPESIEWDWKLNDRLIPPDEEIPIGLALETYSGREYKFLSDPVMLEVERKERIVKRLILVEYVFDESVPSSAFLEGRIFLLAEEVIERAKRGGDFRLEIGGHTDIIGSNRRNIQLSEQRARREIERLYIALGVMLEKNKTGVQDYLDSKSIKIETKGYGSNLPFTINSITTEKPILIGDNDTPRGRTANRRVIATFYSK